MKMHKSPELWAMLMTWIAEHRSEGSYAFIAGLMAILRGIYNGDSPWWRRILDAGMCALVAFFIKDLLMLMSFDQQWAYIRSRISSQSNNVFMISIWTPLSNGK